MNAASAFFGFVRIIFIFGLAKKYEFFAEIEHILDRRVIQKVVPAAHTYQFCTWFPIVNPSLSSLAIYYRKPYTNALS